MSRTLRTSALVVLFAAVVALAGSFFLGAPVAIGQNYTVIGSVWKDVNCDGVRQADEPALPGMTVSLIGQGSDRQMYTGDDRLLEQISSDGNAGQFVFTRGGPYGDKYAVAIFNGNKPAGYQPAPYMQGADRAIDNDLYMPLADQGSPLWATTAFEMHADRSSVTDIDIGLSEIGVCSGQPPVERTEVIYLPMVVQR